MIHQLYHIENLFTVFHGHCILITISMSNQSMLVAAKMPINVVTVFSCDQAALQMVFSVCPSVTPFSLCSHHWIIMEFSGLITNDKSKDHAKDQGQRSKVKITEVKTKLECFRTVTPVLIHIWWWNNAHSLMLLRKGALSFFKASVKFQGHTAKKIVNFDPNWPFPDCNSSLNSTMATRLCTKLEVA